MLLEEALETFLIEAEELLQEVERQLLVLEATPSDEDAINALFRGFHTLKGSAGIIGIVSIERFTHWCESVLERVRLKEIQFDSDLVELLLKSHDHLQRLFGWLSHGEDSGEPDQNEVKLVDQLHKYLPDSAESVVEEETNTEYEDDEAVVWKVSIQFGIDTFRDGFDPTSFITHLTTIGEIVTLQTHLEAIPNLEKIEPESCYLNVDIQLKTEFGKHEIEEVFDFLGDALILEITSPESKSVDYIDKIRSLPESSDDIPVLDAHVGTILIESGALTKKELAQALSDQDVEKNKDDSTNKPRLGNILAEKGVVSPQVLNAALEKQKPLKAHQKSKTIRIETTKLDRFIDLIGELVIATAGINEHSKRLKDRELQESSSVMSRLVEEIREGIMGVRMIPIEDTFTRFRRVVRDISHEIGKKIRVEVSGEDAELDKTVIERIVDPLMHLIRNSIDHGIETPEERKLTGKPEEGIIQLNAYHDAGSIVIEITDDGAGINRQKLLDKAFEKGLIQVGQSLNDQEILNLVFSPGLSTAKKVTKISGRGVGMDVVKSNIESLRGNVEVESEDGVGTVFRIRLPLTLAIIEGLLIRVGESFYVIPVDMVVECTDLPSDAYESTHHYIDFRESVIPFLWLRDLFEEEKENKLSDQRVVVIRSGKDVAGVVVDELLGEMQAVMKSLDKIYKDVPGVSGATILGDGKVSLILDVPQLIQLAELQEMALSEME
ncbi:MAG: two-component system chemotaxis sensor kinase CheA [bacterium]|jgi:two-component system chemotaxis sensor kinase CheA